MTAEEVHLLRLAGAVGGAVIATSLFPPKHFPTRRALVSVVSGFLLGGVLQWERGWPNEPDLIAGASCIVAALSWWIWHAVLGLLPKIQDWLPSWLKRQG